MDWFSRWRLKEERNEQARPVHAGSILPNYRFVSDDGRLITLDDFGTPLLLVLLPSKPEFGTQFFLKGLEEFARAPGEQTRVLVVTLPEHLSTVVALCDDLPIVADPFTQIMLDLVEGDSAVRLLLGPQREVRYRLATDEQDRVPLAA